MQTVVVEQTIYKSGKNTRSLLTDIRKAVAATSAVCADYVFTENYQVKIGACKFFQLHSDLPVSITIKSNGQSTTMISNVITIAADLEQVVVNNCQSESKQVHIVYAN